MIFRFVTFLFLIYTFASAYPTTIYVTSQNWYIKRFSQTTSVYSNSVSQLNKFGDNPCLYSDLNYNYYFFDCNLPSSGSYTPSSAYTISNSASRSSGESIEQAITRIFCSSGQSAVQIDTGVYICSAGCLENQIIDPDTGECVCDSGFVLDDSGNCVSPCSTFIPPSEITVNGKTVPFINIFYEDVDCKNYMLENLVQNAACLPSSNFISNGCVRVVGYGDQSDPCEGIVPPVVYNGLPYQGKYPSMSWCLDAVRYFSVDNTGECIASNPCPYFFAYYKRSDGNTSSSPDTYNSSDLPFAPFAPGSTNTGGPVDLGTPSRTDNNDDGIDLNPLLNQIGDASDRNHNDMQNLIFHIDSLGSLLNSGGTFIAGSGGSGGVSVDLSGVEQRLDNLNTDQGPDIPDDSPIDDFISNFQTQFSTIQTSLENAKNILIGGIPNITIPSGTDPSVSGTVMGMQVTFSSCETLQSIRPAITLIFLISFTYLAIKIFWAAIKLILRG